MLVCGEAYLCVDGVGEMSVGVWGGLCVLVAGGRDYLL